MKLNEKNTDLMFALLDIFYSGKNNKIENIGTLHKKIRDRDPEFAKFIEDLHEGSRQISSRGKKIPNILHCENEISEDQIKEFKRFYKLTNKEESVLTAICSFEDVEAAAKSINMGKGTFNNHLYSIYNKAGTDSKSHLFYLLYSSRGKRS